MLNAVLVIVLAIGLPAGLWLALGRGPRRSRAYRRARRLMGRGNWAEALALAEAQQANGLPLIWSERFRTLAGECHQFIAEVSLKNVRFEESLEHGRKAATLLKLDEGDQVTRVVERMLAEARRLFSRREYDAVVQLLQRTFAIRRPCPEGSFWLGLCQIRKGDFDAAMALLSAAHEQSGKQFIDTGYYLGLLLHMRGKAQESLRYLAEANRVDGSCPFVTLQMGISLVAAGGDAAMATRALRRALGPRGLPMWLNSPDRARVEAFPEGHSFVRRLAEQNPFVCPILGAHLATIVRQGRQALAEALYRQGSFQESADIWGQVLQEVPPTAALLRGYGLALARLERYDQAYRHLRTALEEEQNKDPLTAGYLALCGAKARPTQPEDKPKNLTWAMRLMARYPLPANGEWCGLLSAVHDEARGHEIAVGVEDQLLLCDALATQGAVDATAASVYRHLSTSYPAALQPRHAILFARAAATGAATVIGTVGELNLFACAFGDAAGLRGVFEKQGWDVADAEYAYLVCAAKAAPGRFPEALGIDYAARGEEFLLARSRQSEQAGDLSAARAAAEVLLRLSPQSPAAHDRLACLLYRSGEMDRANDLLSGWCRLAPGDARPLVRRAIIEQERGRADRRAELIERALDLTSGQARAAIAFVGARLELRQCFAGPKPKSALNGSVRHELPPGLGEAKRLLEECLRDWPEHPEATWCLAAILSLSGERDRLAALAVSMDRPRVRDARFHYLAAVACLAAGQPGQALELVRRAAFAAPDLAGDAYYLRARVHLQQGDGPEAREALEHAAAADGPSAALAQTLLGRESFVAGEREQAVSWWERVDAGWRAALGVDEPLRRATFLAGVDYYRAGGFAAAAERFRQAASLGLRDPRLEALRAHSLVQAARALLTVDTQT
jgi:tetratricopeptide (TPR) repeat protein